MRQRRRISYVLYLPQEIIRDILKRLPVKSLIRFQCVCKDWKNLIQDPTFIADHLQQSSHQKPQLLFHVCQAWQNLIRDPTFIADHLQQSGHQNPHLIFQRCRSWRFRLLDCRLRQFREVQQAHLIDPLKGHYIVASCNGLLCVEIDPNSYSPSLLLWNPATAAVRHVPRTDCFDLFDECVTGFGFSPIVNDYKIVRTYHKLDYAVHRAEVFSLGRGTWKKIDVGNLKGLKLNSQVLTANGAIFWFGEKLGAEEEGYEDGTEEGELDVPVIVSFDIAKEVFTVIAGPNIDFADDTLIVYENKLAILYDNYENGSPDSIDLWVLDEGTCASRERCGWTKRYTSGPLPCRVNSVVFWSNEIVFRRDDRKGRTVLYRMNVTTNEVKRLVVVPFAFWSVHNYMESLVSVGNHTA